MPLGLVLSVCVHLAIFGFAFLTFAGADRLTSASVDSLPVELISLSEKTELQRGAKHALLDTGSDTGQIMDQTPPAETPPAQSPPPSPPPPKDAPSPAPPKAETQTEAEPAALPVPASRPRSPAPEQKPVEPEPVQPEPAQPERDVLAEIGQIMPASPPPRAETNRQAFDPEQIAALLDKSMSDAAPEQAERGRVGSSEGEAQDVLDVSEIDALKMQISRCWVPIVGAKYAEDLKVRVRLSLNRDGDVDSLPVVLNARSSAAFNAAADEARRAILRCAPYQLSPEKYNLWRELIINFDPREWLGAASS